MHALIAGRLLAFSAGLLATGCIGTLDLTSEREKTPQLALWANQNRENQLIGGCARVYATVSKSGKTGLGMTFLVQGEGERRCEVELLESRLLVGGLTVHEAYGPPRLRVTREDAVWFYLPFLFDNLSVWKRGLRTAQLIVRFRADGHEEKELVYPLEQSP